jgi:hypothetical protein
MHLKNLMIRFGGKFPLKLNVDIGIRLTHIFKALHNKGYSYKDLCPK